MNDSASHPHDTQHFAYKLPEDRGRFNICLPGMPYPDKEARKTQFLQLRGFINFPQTSVTSMHAAEIVSDHAGGGKAKSCSNRVAFYL